MRRTWRLFAFAPALLMTICLASCGGGGEDEEEDVEDAEATGLWSGTLTPAGQAAGAAALYVAPDGTFTLSSSRALFTGSGNTSGTAFTAGATGWAPTATTFVSGANSAAFTFNGQISGGSLTGTYSGGGESGSYSMTLNAAASALPASLAAIAGTYVVLSTGLPTVGLSIDTSGRLNYTALGSGCVLSGQVRAPGTDPNYYTWSATPSGCTVTTTLTGYAWMTTTTTAVFSGTAAGQPVILGGTKPAAGSATTVPLEGFFAGGLTGATGATAFQALVLENGEIWGLYGRYASSGFRVESFVQGSGSSTAGVYNASVRDFFDYPASAASVKLDYDPATRILGGTVTAGADTTQVFGGSPGNAVYNYNAVPSLSTVAGQWTLVDLEGFSYAVAVATNGTFTFTENGGGCSGTGLLAPRASGKNVFNLSVTFGSSADCELPGQTATGIAIAYLDGTRTQFIVAGTDAARTVGTVLSGAR